jgi:hypothetical protein
MTHIAIQERLDGKAVEWMAHVSAEQYQGWYCSDTARETEPVKE